MSPPLATDESNGGGASAGGGGGYEDEVKGVPLEAAAEGNKDSYAMGALPDGGGDEPPISAEDIFCVRSTALLASSYLLNAAFSCSAVWY